MVQGYNLKVFVHSWQKTIPYPESLAGTMIVFFFFLLAGQTFVSSQSTFSQDQFKQELINAVSKNQEKAADTLIRNHRLMVKPFVDGLIREAITLELKSKLTESAKLGTVTVKTAEKFNDIFYEKSLLIAVNYLTIWTRQQKSEKLTADSLYIRGTKFRLENEFENSETTLQKALSVYMIIGDERGEAEVLGGLGALYFNNNDHQKAYDYYKKALIKREKVDDKFLMGNTLNSLGSVSLRLLKDYPLAISYYEKAEAVRSEIGDINGLRTSMSYKAAAYKEFAEQLNTTGRFSEAIDFLEKAYEIDKNLGDRIETGDVLNLLGYVYIKLGDYNTAAEKLSGALQIMKEEKDTVGLAGVYNHFGIVLQKAGRTEKALEYYNNSLKIYEERNDLSNEIPVLDNLGTLYFDLKDYATALDYHRRGLAICRETDDREKEVDFLLNLANDNLFLGKKDEAFALYEEGLRIARLQKNPDLIWRFTAGMAEVYESGGDFEKVVELNDSAITVLEGIRNTLEDEELKSAFMARERYAFEDIIDMLTTLHFNHPEKGYDKLAFKYAEKSKSRVLLDLLAGSDKNANKNLMEDASLLNSEPVTLDEALSLCKDKNSVILEYSVGDSSSCLWVITAKGHKLFRLPDRRILQEQIETIRFALLDPSQGISEFFTTTGSSLYDELIKPTELFLTKKSHLIIIPDGVLNYLPFEVLLTSKVIQSKSTSYNDVPFLIRKYPVSYAQSASVLKTLIGKMEQDNNKDRGEKKLFAFGDPVYEDTSALSQPKYPRLEFSGIEVENISSFFKPGSSDVFLRNNATEESLKQKGDLDKYGYIHFATHGLINEENPDLSSLVLTTGRNSVEDGFLTAREVFKLKLNADLVVLSACQTGLGKLVRGEGMVGLTRAFMYAGAPSVLVSLWSVSDKSTADLMDEFYRKLVRDSHSKTDALREAQLKLINDPKFSHPFYWAPFILVGDWR